MEIDYWETDEHRWISWGDFEMHFWKKAGVIEIGLLTPEDETEVGEVIVPLPIEVTKALMKWMEENEIDDTVSTRPIICS